VAPDPAKAVDIEKRHAALLGNSTYVESQQRRLKVFRTAFQGSRPRMTPVTTL
jgi:hypothetical protein